jgi:hypothetical protein
VRLHLTKCHVQAFADGQAHLQLAHALIRLKVAACSMPMPSGFLIVWITRVPVPS